MRVDTGFGEAGRAGGGEAGCCRRFGGGEVIEAKPGASTVIEEGEP